MQNPDTFYLSAAEYRKQTTVPTLANPLTGDEVTSLLLETMTEIDAYIGGGWAPLVDGQEFTFPRFRDTDYDGNAAIPRPVAMATRILADATLQLRAKGVLPHMVAGESKLGHTITKYDKGQKQEPGYEHWPPQMFALLEKYRHNGGQLAVNDPWITGSFNPAATGWLGEDNQW